MKIRPTADRRAWHVTALWHGQERIVYTGSVYECLHFVREETGMSYAAGND